MDFIAHITTLDCREAWNGLDVTKLVPTHPPSAALDLGKKIQQTGEYHDVHCWVFTPVSFVELMKQLARCGCLPFKCSTFFDTEKFTLEFFVTLKKSDDQNEIIASWEAAQASLKHDDQRQLAAGPPIQAVAVSDVTEGASREHPMRIDMLKLENARLRQHAARLESALEELRASHSWRITGPLRAVRDSFRR